jgi:RNA polymerase sigma factor (sigma-70 family)
VTPRRRRETPALAEVFERLVRRHRSEIFRAVLRLSRNREDAEDLTQITFLNAYTALQRGAEPEAPRAWLHAIARNAGSRRLRQSRFVEVELDPEEAQPWDEETPTVQELQMALARLTLNQRASLLMREVGGLSAKEIGVRLGITPEAVATLLFRARQAVRAELELAPGEPKRRSRLGGLGVLVATVVRPAWLRLLGPVSEGSEALSRTAAAVSVAAVAAGVAVFTSTVPLSARAEHARAASAATPIAAVHHVAYVRAAPRARGSIPKIVHGGIRLAVVPQSRVHAAAAAARAPAPARVSSPHVRLPDPVVAPPVAHTLPAQVTPPPVAAAPEQAPAGETQRKPTPEHADDPVPDVQAATQPLVTTATQAAVQVPSTDALVAAAPSVPAPELPPAPVALPVDASALVVPPPAPPLPLSTPSTGLVPTG